MKIVVTGPESTGKTTLSASLASHFKTEYVPEYARSFLNESKGAYTESDLQKIAQGQVKLEEEYRRRENSLLILDTSLEVIRVWSEWKYGRCSQLILDQARRRTPDLFLLLKPDFPWQPDPLRENPDDRDELFSYYQKSLAEYDTSVVEIGGNKAQRLESAIEAIEKLGSV